MNLPRPLLAALLFLFAVVVAQAQHAELPEDYAGPLRVDLSGTWDFRLDPDRRGEQERWFAPLPLPQTGQWRQLAVPGSWNEQLASDAAHPAESDRMRFAQGAAWYRTSFPTPVGCKAASSGSICLLHLAGTVLRHTVWMNGKPVGHSDRPYLEETYDVTGLLRPTGDNSLAIEVDNSIEQNGVPDRNWHGWWNDGGLIRPVYLELRPVVHSQSHVETIMEGKGLWRLKIETTTSHPASPLTVRILYRLEDTGHREVWTGSQTLGPTGGANPPLSVALPNLEAWSPERPALYTLTTTTVAGEQSDRVQVRIGFRQIETRGTKVYLNGKPYSFRGMSRHQFLAGRGMSLSIAEDRADLADIKSMGSNFVRLAHYSQSQDVYDACDELGLLVWTEIPAWQSRTSSLTDPVVWEREIKPQLQGMVEQHRNHPSVVVWSVGNEIGSDLPENAGYVAKAVAYVKSLDKTRLVTFASDRREKDKAFGAVDLISINEYFGWYYGTPEEVGPMLDNMHRKFPDKPILVSEFGADGVADWSAAASVPNSRNYSYAAQDAFLKSHMKQIFAPERRSFVAGGIVWLYNDFPDPHRIGGDHPVSANYRNNKGLVTMQRERKPAYDTVRSFFASLEKASGNH